MVRPVIGLGRRTLILLGVVLIMLLTGCLPQPFRPYGGEATTARTDAWPTVGSGDLPSTRQLFDEDLDAGPTAPRCPG